MRKPAWLLLLLMAPVLAQAQEHGSPYAGRQEREIKALSADRVQAYLEGRGMELALAAELNHYPGPLHVLELAAPLKLTAAHLRRHLEMKRILTPEQVKRYDELRGYAQAGVRHEGHGKE